MAAARSQGWEANSWVQRVARAEGTVLQIILPTNVRMNAHIYIRIYVYTEYTYITDVHI